MNGNTSYLPLVDFKGLELRLGFYGNEPIWFESGVSLDGFWFSLPTQEAVIISPRRLSTPAIGSMAAIFHDPLQKNSYQISDRGATLALLEQSGITIDP